MLPQGDLRIHAAEIDVASVVFTGPVAVEQDVVHLDIALILALTLDTPLAGDLGVMHLNIPPYTARCVQRLKDELPDIFRIQPCGADVYKRQELLALCNTIYVFVAGNTVARFSRENFNKVEILKAAVGGAHNEE